MKRSLGRVALWAVVVRVALWRGLVGIVGGLVASRRGLVVASLRGRRGTRVLLVRILIGIGCLLLSCVGALVGIRRLSISHHSWRWEHSACYSSIELNWNKFSFVNNIIAMISPDQKGEDDNHRYPNIQDSANSFLSLL
jgi:hypothetical protein